MTKEEFSALQVDSERRIRHRVLPLGIIYSIRVAVAGGDAVAVVHLDHAAVPGGPVREADHPGARGQDRAPVFGADVQPAVERPVDAAERIGAPA